ncbi:unnamed protein product [marine sediment metagenome]|uniref:Uncharacterized protein n=1 Tax=marine sediment metagenome TaxID=412755 RepID=X0ZPQ9_9ZZZZ
MKIAKTYGQYTCPYNKFDGKTPGKITMENSKSTISGRYCKNNCGLYMNNCDLFKKD